MRPAQFLDLDVVAELLDLLVCPGAESVPGCVQAAGRHRQAQRCLQIPATGQAGAERGEHRVAGAARLQGLHPGAGELQVTSAGAVENQRGPLGARR